MSEKIELAVSKDGYTNTDWRARDMPDYGDYSDPMPVWRRLGNARRFSGRLRFSDPCVVSVVCVEIEAG